MWRRGAPLRVEIFSLFHLVETSRFMFSDLCGQEVFVCVCVCLHAQKVDAHASHSSKHSFQHYFTLYTSEYSSCVCVYVCVYRSITPVLLCTHSLPVCRLVFPVCEHIWSSWRPACSADAASAQGERHTLRQLPVLPARSHAPAAQHLHHR